MILYDGRAPDTLEDTIQLSYRPEEFRERLLQAGTKEDTAFRLTKRIYENRKKGYT